MKTSRVIPQEAKRHFWSVVKECLVQLHHRPRAWSQSTVRKFRTKIEALPQEQMELFYHSEPFDVACRLAGQLLDMEAHLSRYLQIRDGDDSKRSQKATG